MVVVTPEEIALMPRRYAIGKRPLSILLGWGELTYTRLIDGNTPTKEHAKELRLMLDDPGAYARVLERGRDRLTEVAYNRSFAAVDEMLADRGGVLRATRIYDVADRLCWLARGDITPNGLQRLVYYAQGVGLAELGYALFDELPRAAADGPFYDRICAVYSYGEIQRAASIEVPAKQSRLSKPEASAIKEAYSRYRDFSSDCLSKMSREESPWKKARKRAGARVGEDCAELITAKSMKKFFAK